MMTLHGAVSVAKEGAWISMSHIISYGNFSPQLELSDAFLDLRDSKDFSSQHYSFKGSLVCEFFDVFSGQFYG